MTAPMSPDRLARLAALVDATGQERDRLLADAGGEMVAEIVRSRAAEAERRDEAERLRRSCRELGKCLHLAIVIIRAAWVEAQHAGADEGIEALAELVHETGWDGPDLDQYATAEAVFDAEWTTSDPSTATKHLRAQLAEESP